MAVPFPLRRLLLLLPVLLSAHMAAGKTGDATALPEGPPAGAVHLASLDWPPFTGATLPDQGRVTRTVRSAMERTGQALTVEFFPWQRVLAAGLTDKAFAGYFPEYADAEHARDCLLSRPIATSPLGFAERTDTPVSWNRLEDLAGRRIGTVRGYVNNPQLDEAIASGRLTAEPAVDDATNLRKLAAGRLDLIVIDANVMAFLLASDPDLMEARAKLRLNSHILEHKTLHVCFRSGEEGRRLRSAFDAGLAELPEIRAGQQAVLP